MSSKDSLSLVGYCGLYCGLGAQRNRIPQLAKNYNKVSVKKVTLHGTKVCQSGKIVFPCLKLFIRACRLELYM